MGVELFENKEHCCGCSACASICPKGAITMELDEFGFSYPNVDSERCISCGACKRVCAYQNGISLNEPLCAYVAVNKNEEQLYKSASGGVFAAIATYILNNNGIVFGASLDFEDGHPKAHLIGIEELCQLERLQGSKYVQSAVEETYKKVKCSLENGREVLFSGTPCQVAGLYGFLNKDYKKLWTIDVICHGVPNLKFFDDYISLEGEKHKAIPIGYSFRDKKKGWGMNSRMDLKMHSGKTNSVFIPARLTSYNTLFLDGDTYRENCYECPYAKRERVSDMTIGDFWGIENEHPDLLSRNEYDENKGISCIVVNTQKGKQLCENVSDKLWFSESSFEKIAKKNGQLTHPSIKSEKREVIMKIYMNSGYEGIDKWFHKKYRKQIILHTIYNKIPRRMRRIIKSAIKK